MSTPLTQSFQETVHVEYPLCESTILDTEDIVVNKTHTPPSCMLHGTGS